MLNYLWAGMIIIGVVFGAFRGVMPEITEAALSSSKEAITLSLTMLGIMSFWTGLMEIATKAGIIEGLANIFRPVIRFLFPRIPKEHKANEYIATNFIANMLGLGWAATPAGLRAMEALAELNEEDTASNEMCNFLILNISSLQLIPMTMIAYRSQYGSADPAGIIGPGLLATAISTLAAVLFCKIMEGVSK